MYAHSSRPTTSQPVPDCVLAHTACSMPSAPPTYAIVGRIPPVIGLASITATVERSTPPSAGSKLEPFHEPASTREINVVRLVVLRFAPMIGPSVATVAFFVSTYVSAGRKPAAVVVNTVRQLAV